MGQIAFDYKKASAFLAESEIFNLKEYVKVAHNAVHEKTGAGNDFLGWVDLPKNYDKLCSIYRHKTRIYAKQRWNCSTK